MYSLSSWVGMGACTGAVGWRTRRIRRREENPSDRATGGEPGVSWHSMPCPLPDGALLSQTHPIKQAPDPARARLVALERGGVAKQRDQVLGQAAVGGLVGLVQQQVDEVKP